MSEALSKLNGFSTGANIDNTATTATTATAANAAPILSPNIVPISEQELHSLFFSTATASNQQQNQFKFNPIELSDLENSLLLQQQQQQQQHVILNEFEKLSLANKNPSINNNKNRNSQKTNQSFSNNKNNNKNSSSDINFRLGTNIDISKIKNIENSNKNTLNDSGESGQQSGSSGSKSLNLFTMNNLDSIFSPDNSLYMPGTASLIQDVDKQLMVILRDGRTLIGYLRSIDQYANLLLSNTIERIHVGNKYGDIPRGIYIVRGENVVLIGEVDFSLPSKVAMNKVDEQEILDLQKQEQTRQQDLEKNKKKTLLNSCLLPQSDSILDDYY